MEKAKNEIIADLYALRGGLSVISQYSNEIKGLESKTQSASLISAKSQSKYTTTKKEIDKLEGDLQQEFGEDSIGKELRSKIDAKNRGLSNLKTQYSALNTEITPEEKKEYKRLAFDKRIRFAGVLLIFIALCIPLMIIVLLKEPSDLKFNILDFTILGIKMYDLLYILFYLCTLGAVIGLIATFVWLINLTKEYKDDYSRFIERAREEKRNKRRELADKKDTLQAELSDLTKQLLFHQQERQKQKTEHEKFIANTQQKLIEKKEELAKQRIIYINDDEEASRIIQESQEIIDVIAEKSKLLKKYWTKHMGFGLPKVIGRI